MLYHTKSNKKHELISSVAPIIKHHPFQIKNKERNIKSSENLSEILKICNFQKMIFMLFWMWITSENDKNLNNFHFFFEKKSDTLTLNRHCVCKRFSKFFYRKRNRSSSDSIFDNSWQYLTITFKL